MKIYAKQVNPEYQESPCFFWGLADTYPGVIFTGNRHYTSHTTPEYDHITRYIDDISSEWENRNYNGTRNAPTINELLRDYGIYRNDGKPWSTKARHTWRLIFEGNTYTEDGAILKALELVTGKEYESATIRGCSQGDWQEILFPVEEYDRDALAILEADYFNTGTEWIIHDESSEPNSPEDISGYSLYCYGWNADQIRAEIADAAGATPETVTMYEYAGVYTIAKYNKVGA